VFDGHGGEGAAGYAAAVLPALLARSPEWAAGDVGGALLQAFAATDEGLRRRQLGLRREDREVGENEGEGPSRDDTVSPTAGTTALVAVIHNDVLWRGVPERAMPSVSLTSTLSLSLAPRDPVRSFSLSLYLSPDLSIYLSLSPFPFTFLFRSLSLSSLRDGNRVANSGDCRAVLSRRGRPVCVTRDHKPSTPGERARVLAAGARVCPEGFLNGHLGVTRALGDWGLDEKREGGHSGGVILGEPEVRAISLSDDHDFLIAACDGLWDVMPTQRALEHARISLRGDPSIPMGAAAAWDATACSRALAREATVARGSTDNVTVAVALLRAGPHGPRQLGGGGVSALRRPASRLVLATLDTTLLAVAAERLDPSRE